MKSHGILLFSDVYCVLKNNIQLEVLFMIQKLISLLKKSTATLLLTVTLSATIQDTCFIMESTTIECYQEVPELPAADSYS